YTIVSKNKFKKRGRVPLCCTLGAVWIIIIYRSVKFESNDKYLTLYTKNDSERR
ncbi:Uncharacterized protein FWK35_00003752, partial [Aphis craccivora]